MRRCHKNTLFIGKQLVYLFAQLTQVRSDRDVEYRKQFASIFPQRQRSDANGFACEVDLLWRQHDSIRHLWVSQRCPLDRCGELDHFGLSDAKLQPLRLASYYLGFCCSLRANFWTAEDSTECEQTPEDHRSLHHIAPFSSVTEADPQTFIVEPRSELYG